MPRLATHDPVYHVGDLNGSRSKPRFSYEGRGLCVSHHPEDWRQIAEQVYGTTYELTREDGSGNPLFYEVRCDDGSADPDAEWRQWAINAGFVHEVQGYAVPSPNGGEYRFYKRERAEREADALEEDAPIREEPVLALNSRGKDYWNSAFRLPASKSNPVPLADLTVVWYAQHGLPVDVDGVWWDYRHDPADLSCPCGVIFQSQLEKWGCREAHNPAAEFAAPTPET